jgi:hypothetical protein
MPATPADRPVPLVDRSPALTNVAFAPGVVAQSLEALLVDLAGEGARLLHPIHAPTLRLGWRADLQPGDILVGAARRYGLDPLLVHSTSWRFEDARVVLTYMVVVRAPAELDVHLAADPVRRAPLARGEATGPPPSIDIAQVTEHAFRHLAWLIQDDDVVRSTLPNWAGFLSRYEPEPFRAFGAPPAGTPQ